MKADAISDKEKTDMAHQILLELVSHSGYIGDSEMIELAETSAKMVNRMIETLQDD